MSREIKFRGWDNDMNEWTTAFDMDNDGVVYSAQTPYSDSPDIRIMQYTGLKDKNGKEIFEGDVVNCKDDGQFTVCWNEAGAFFDLAGLDDDDMLSDRLVSEYAHTNHGIEVIGNIYENPELVK